MLKLLLVVVLVGAGALVLLARGTADAPLRDDRDRPRSKPVEREREPERKRERPRLKPARCPDGVPGCRAVTGRIYYVEAVDPDGDGDLHVVIAAGGITLPGLTAV